LEVATKTDGRDAEFEIPGEPIEVAERTTDFALLKLSFWYGFNVPTWCTSMNSSVIETRNGNAEMHANGQPVH
jgi:hypothetical protein